MNLKTIIKRLFIPNNTHLEAALIQTKHSKPKGDVIECHDCHKLGYIVIDGPGDYTMPPGWKLVWCGLKPLYICGECGAKRRKFALEQLRK